MLRKNKQPLIDKGIYMPLVLPDPYLTTTQGMLFDEDCLRILSLMKDESIDTVFADPPFNLGKVYGAGFSDRFSKSEFMNWCEVWIGECSRVIRPGGSFFLYATPELAYHFAGILEKTLESGTGLR